MSVSRHLARKVLLLALAIYALGVCAWLSHQVAAAVAIYSFGIVIAAAGGWLSCADETQAGTRQAVTPFLLRRREPRFDWDSFERDFRFYVERRRDSASPV